MSGEDDEIDEEYYDDDEITHVDAPIEIPITPSINDSGWPVIQTHGIWVSGLAVRRPYQGSWLMLEHEPHGLAMLSAYEAEPPVGVEFPTAWRPWKLLPTVGYEGYPQVLHEHLEMATESDPEVLQDVMEVITTEMHNTFGQIWDHWYEFLSDLADVHKCAQLMLLELERGIG